MPVRCLTGGRFTMSAVLLHQNNDYVPDNDIDLDDYGTWVKSQDPLTGEIVRKWQPTVAPNPTFNYRNPPRTPVDISTFDCLARGIVDGGIRVAGTTERFGDTYENIDYVKMWVPPSTVITKRDRITNIADKSGHIRWLDEEYYDPNNPEDTLKATVFNVNGVTPLFDAFNRIVEQFVLLERVVT